MGSPLTSVRSVSSQCKRVILEEIFTIFLRGKLVLFYKAIYSIVVILKTLDNYSIGNLADNYSLIILYCNSSEVITSALYKLLDELNKTVHSPESTARHSCNTALLFSPQAYGSGLLLIWGCSSLQVASLAYIRDPLCESVWLKVDFILTLKILPAADVLLVANKSTSWLILLCSTYLQPFKCTQ